MTFNALCNESSLVLLNFIFCLQIEAAGKFFPNVIILK